MNEDKGSSNDILDEFRTLGENLASTLRSVWESPERKRLQSEVEEGLVELNNTLKKEVESFKEGSTGQRLKADIDELKESVSSGEASRRAREELHKALKYINTELSNFMQEFESKDSGEQGSDT